MSGSNPRKTASIDGLTPNLFLAADALLAGEADICTSADFILVSNSFEHDDPRIGLSLLLDKGKGKIFS